MNVLIERPSFVSLTLSNMEVFRRETDGLLIGRDAYRKIGDDKIPVRLIETVYPLQTSERKPSEVGIGNKYAFNRVVRSLKSLGIDLISGSGSSDLKLIGGYHSHPDPRGHVILNEYDIKYRIKMIREMKRQGEYKPDDSWLELVMHVRKKDYTESYEPNHTFRDYPWKIGTILRFGRNGHEITMAGYLLSIHECSIEGFGEEEVLLYAPKMFE
jgi:hypothetical protein